MCPHRSARPLAEAPLLSQPQAVLLAYSEASWAQVSGQPAVTAIAPVVAVPVTPPASLPPPPSPPPAVAANTAVTSWLWPADGALVGRFGAAGGKGIDIVGKRNAPVRAVAPGKVVYSGSGLRGYGQPAHRQTCG
jgi:lipoprotein NlpD